MIYHLLLKKNAYFYISVCKFLNICLLKKVLKTTNEITKRDKEWEIKVIKTTGEVLLIKRVYA